MLLLQRKLGSVQLAECSSDVKKSLVVCLIFREKIYIINRKMSYKFTDRLLNLLTTSSWCLIRTIIAVLGAVTDKFKRNALLIGAHELVGLANSSVIGAATWLVRLILTVKVAIAIVIFGNALFIQTHEVRWITL
jgi:hypothetical protein